MTVFYTYLYLIDGVPEYCGKGKDGRCLDHITKPNSSYWSRHLHKAIREDKQIAIRLTPHLSEAIALAHECQTIASIGRRDNSTGTLFNLTDGGEGTSGWRPTPAQRQLASEAQRRPSVVMRKSRPRSETAKQNMRGSHGKPYVAPPTPDQLAAVYLKEF
jgi:hypothetical protein